MFVLWNQEWTQLFTYTRKQLVASIRSRAINLFYYYYYYYYKFINIFNLLIAGYDITSPTPNLHWIDFFGTCTSTPFAVSLLDRYRHSELTLEEAKVLIKKCE